MKKEETYYQSNYNDKFLTYNLIIILLLFIFVIVFFNDYPKTSFELFIDNILIKEHLIFSQRYPFQSQIISNIVMIFAPISGFLLALTLKYKTISKEELIELGAIIETNKFKILLLKFFVMIGLVLFIAMVIFLVYIDYTPLTEVARRNTFIRDTAITVIFFPFLYYGLLMVTVAFFLNIISNPKKVCTYQYHFPYDRKDKIRLLMKNKRKNEK
ncbi:hypothetical protein BKK50_01695 [Rodentibacter rarus]|uniref:Uncharacterized protein n=1 Tax=Rodentibacter rarus TaxID=1908260 RepID=A0A1V3IRT5_9PAST|nr:hypothetical protein [Rodentibacter rarus]OOF44664.1 hypothetical protein BKK50_01695 [Rodentibacter rarus]